MGIGDPEIGRHEGMTSESGVFDDRYEVDSLCHGSKPQIIGLAVYLRWILGIACNYHEGKEKTFVRYWWRWAAHQVERSRPVRAATSSPGHADPVYRNRLLATFQLGVTSKNMMLEKIQVCLTKGGLSSRRENVLLYLFAHAQG